MHQALLVSACQRADIESLSPSELLAMAAWAACLGEAEAQPVPAAAAAAVSGADALPGAPAAPVGEFAEGTNGGDTISPLHLSHLLAALESALLSGAVDATWLQATHDSWRAGLGAVMAEARAQRLAADAGQGGPAGCAAAVAIEALLLAAAEWCESRGCVTAGSASLLRQVGGGENLGSLRVLR
jgi:hypothetical protein